MQIAIFTEGGPAKGFGHLSRCAALSCAFHEAGDSVTVCLDAPEDLCSFFPGAKCEVASWSTDYRTCAKYLVDANVAIFDSYLAEESFYHLLAGKSACQFVFFDDTLRIVYPRGLILNGSAEAQHYVDWQRRGYQFLVGSAYQPIRRPFWDCRTRECNSQIHHVLLTMGGDDILELMPRVYGWLVECLPEASITVISTRYSRTFDRLSELVQSPNRLMVDVDAESLAGIMQHADLAIVSGGQTVYELARTGLPAILIQVVDNQKTGIEAWLKSGFALSAFIGEDPSLRQKLQSAMSLLKDQSVRQTRARIGQTMVDGQGARRVVRAIREAVQ